jgi:hypothetical protein
MHEAPVPGCVCWGCASGIITEQQSLTKKRDIIINLVHTISLETTCLLLSEQTTHDRDVARAALLLVLALSARKHVADGSQAKTTKQLVDA